MFFPKSIQLILLSVFLVLLAPIAFAQNELYVQVAKTKLRREAKAWGAQVTDLSYGDKLTVIKEQESWFEVSAGKFSGFIHQSAVTNRKVVLKSEQRSLADLAVDEETVLLAGKGFGENVEQRYRENVKGANYSELEKILSKAGSEESQIIQFIKTGGLND